MSEKRWRSLLAKLNIEFDEPIRPATEADLEAFEEKKGIRLPASYRTFCTTFGAGIIAQDVTIAAPGRRRASFYSLEHLDDLAHNGLEPQTYSKDPEQHRRGLFFGSDGGGSFHFFDPYDSSTGSKREYGVYTLFRDYTVQKTASSFWEFISEVCLGSLCDRLSLFPLDEAPPQTFLPA